MTTKDKIIEIKNIAIKNGWCEENNGLFTKYPINKFLTKEQFKEYMKLK
jgi:hypothetical protein